MVAKQPGQPTEALLAEIERLKGVVKCQEEELVRNRHALEKFQKDQEFYKRALLNELKKGYTEDQLRRWAEEEDTEGVPLSAFIADVERMVHEHSSKQ